MTLPIAFTPTPHDLNTDNADATDAFTQVSTTTKNNLEKVNTFLRAQVPTVARSLMAAGAQTGFFIANTTFQFTVGQWPACTITLPPRPQSLMISFGCSIYAPNYGAGNWFGVTYRLSGAGTTFTGNEDYLRRILCNACGVGCGRTVVIPGSKLVGGGQVTASPWWIVSCPAGTNVAGTAAQGGCITMVATAA
jgi:hypothetical protein